MNPVTGAPSARAAPTAGPIGCCHPSTLIWPHLSSAAHPEPPAAHPAGPPRQPRGHPLHPAGRRADTWYCTQETVFVCVCVCVCVCDQRIQMQQLHTRTHARTHAHTQHGTLAYVHVTDDVVVEWHTPASGPPSTGTQPGDAIDLISYSMWVPWQPGYCHPWPYNFTSC